MHIRNAKQVRALHSEHGEIVYELVGAAAGGTNTHSLAEIVLPPGRASLKHYHPTAEESYYILSGIARLVVDGESTVLGPGDGVVILPDQVHQILNDGDADLIFLAVCVPAWTPDNSVYLD
jgi:mannose-6-phosphate isomerase-like protein (cupin superfamily)